MVDKINAGSPSYLWNVKNPQAAEKATKELDTQISDALYDKSPIEDGFYPDVSFTKAQISGELKKNATEMGKEWDPEELEQTAQDILDRYGYDTDEMESRLNQIPEAVAYMQYTNVPISDETGTGFFAELDNIAGALAA